MSNAQVKCLIMAGGKGTRLWPESTAKKPKQYLSLLGGDSLLGQTLKRFDGVVDNSSRFIITTRDQSELAKTCSEGQIQDTGIIYEPAGRNTAPCILLSLAYIEASGASEDDVIAVMPSDHVILDTKGFQKTFLEAVKLSSESNTITTIGIKPHFPHTGFGYIKSAKAIGTGFEVEQFVEKPNFETATKYLQSGEYFWNAGMFMSSLKTFKEEFKAHSPETFKFYAELLENIGNEEKIAHIYSQIPQDSVDYAIMEKSKRVSVVQSNFDWNDLGSWEALEEVIDKESDNTVVSANSVYLKDATGNVIYAPDKFVSLINVEDLVVVSNDKSVMVMPKKDSQRVKEVVQHLKDEGRSELL